MVNLSEHVLEDVDLILNDVEALLDDQQRFSERQQDHLRTMQRITTQFKDFYHAYLTEFLTSAYADNVDAHRVILAELRYSFGSLMVISDLIEGEDIEAWSDRERGIFTHMEEEILIVRNQLDYAREALAA